MSYEVSWGWRAKVGSQDEEIGEQARIGKLSGKPEQGGGGKPEGDVKG